ncbi:50S ribosomal protein L13, partial [Prevotella dentalis DSM 3688]
MSKTGQQQQEDWERLDEPSPPYGHTGQTASSLQKHKAYTPHRDTHALRLNFSSQR